MKSKYPREINLSNLLKKKSFFLFGPRATGKSTLIETTLENAFHIDLLDPKTYTQLIKDPSILTEWAPKGQLIAIDEVQKHPAILDVVHKMIFQKRNTFLLTGSSARKLRSGAANLLAGRAWRADLFPLTTAEIPEFDLMKYLNSGGLPAIYCSKDYEEELENYTSLYLKEEIQSEALTRNIPAFAQFLDLIALSNGEEINLQNFASDSGVSVNTIKNYIQILEDTLIGCSVPPFRKTKKRKAISRSKHYLFDIGVVNTLASRGRIKAKSELFGKAFEQFIFQEIRAYLSYRRLKHQLTYWRSTSDFEVDFIIGNELAIEVKSSSQVQEKHLKGLRALKEEGMIKKYAIVSLDLNKRIMKNGFTIYRFQH